MSPAALKRALDPAYIGSPFAQPFQFFDGDATTPMDLTGRAVVLFLDRQGLPDAHHEITGAIQTDGRVLFSVADTSAWIKGDYSLEVRLDGASVVVGRIVVAKGAGANGSDMVGAAQPPTAPGVVIAGSGVVQVVSVAPSAATDPAGIILPSDLSAALGGAETLADALLWLAQNGGTPSPILRDLIGGVVISSVATGALSVSAAGQVLLSGAISSVSSATGSLTVGSASSIALVGSAVSTSSLTGAMTVVTQIALAGAVTATSSVTGELSVTAGAIANTRNMTAANFPNWRAVRDAATNGTGSATINTVGDSRIAGLGNKNTDINGYTDARFDGPTSILAARLTSKGIPSKNQSLIGTGTAGSSDLTGARLFLSNKMAFAGGATAVLGTFGGLMYRMTAGASVTFTTDPCTDLDLWYPVNSPLGTFSYSIDGSAPISVAQNGSGAQNFLAIPIRGLPAAAHTVVVTGVSGTAYVAGVQVRSLSVPAINIMNGGYGGSASATWATGVPFEAGLASRALLPRLTIIGLGTNDGDVNALRSNLITLVSRARETGDALLVCPGPTSGGGWGAIQSQVHDMYVALSDTLSCGLIDFYTLNGSFATMQAAGKMFDNLHENHAGYLGEWNLVADALSQV